MTAPERFILISSNIPYKSKLNCAVNELKRISRNCSESIDIELEHLRFDNLLFRSGYSDKFIDKAHRVLRNLNRSSNTMSDQSNFDANANTRTHYLK